MTTEQKAALFDEFVERARKIVTNQNFNEFTDGSMLLVRNLADSAGYFPGAGYFSKPATLIKSRDDIQRAHDILEAVHNDEVEIEIPSEVRERLKQFLRALCWVLGHHAGKEFDDSVKQVIKKAEAAGYRLMEIPPFSPGIAYRKNAMIVYKDYVWKCKADNVKNPPPDPSWDLIGPAT